MKNIIKQKAFNERMGSKIGKPRHIKMYRGGSVKKYAAGGNINPATGQPNDQVTALSAPNSSNVNQNAVNPNTGIAGTIGGALGLTNNYQAGAANLQQGTNYAQLNDAYNQAQGGLNYQNRITNSVIPQVGTAVNNQNAVANQLLDMSQGRGPNPAQAQLAQATGQNVANQAALMAGQRGASANAGLIARQAAQQGAATQQAAAGQAATLGAQQQIAAQQNLASLAAQQVAQAQGAVGATNQAAQGEQTILQNANTALNNNNVGMQSNINNVNAETAIANQKQAGNIIGGLASGLSGVAGSIGDAIGDLFSEGGEVHDHHKLAEMNAISLAHHKKHFDKGGGVTIGSNPLLGNQINGGPGPVAAQNAPVSANNPSVQGNQNVEAFNPKDSGENLSNGLSKFTDALVSGGGSSEAPQDSSELMAGGPGDNSGGSLGPLEYPVRDDMTLTASHGGQICEGPHGHVASFLNGGMAKKEVPAKVSAGEIYLNPEQVKDVVHHGANPLKIGYRFPGKAKVKGDSSKNDTIPTTLEDGGVVIKRTVVNTKNPEKAALFVHRAHMKGQR